MKKRYFFIPFLAFGILTLGLGSYSQVQIESVKEESVCHYGQCSAIAKSTGQQCRNCAQSGSAYCWTHNK